MRGARLSRGITQEELADLADLHTTYVSAPT
ncbi:MAG: helix-turn-helix transcriptional regulator [Pseudomonadota bacterium]